jgi:hypothetical protein
MYFATIVTIYCVALSTLTGCASKIDTEARRQELLSLNDKMRTAHLDGDYETIIASHDDPYVAVKNGQVSRPSPEEHVARFKSYMTTMDVTAWDDLIDPIITFSDDASLATVIYRKHLSMVSMSQPDAEPYEGIFVWQSTYRRTPSGWKQISDILTTLPEEELLEELRSLKE